MKAMILAAGRGTRMAPLTDTCPKPLIPLGSKPLILHHIEKLVSSGIREIVINTAWLGDQIEAYLGSGQQYDCTIRYSHESNALETGGGVFQALPLLGNDPFVLINGDVWTDWQYNDLSTYAEIMVARQALGCLFLAENPEHNVNGDFYWDATNEKGTKSSPAVLHAEGMEKLTFSGISILSPELWVGQTSGCYPLAPLLRSGIDRRQILGVKLENSWIDVGTPERLALAEQALNL